MLGDFLNGLGEFYPHDNFEGRKHLLPLHVNDSNSAACRWEQAFSADGGTTWETNWIKDLLAEKNLCHPREI